MIGVGVSPEGINQNYVIYEFALERGWDYNSVNIKEWFDTYTYSRYGVRDSSISLAWQKLVVKKDNLHVVFIKWFTPFFFFHFPFDRKVFTLSEVHVKSVESI